MKLSMVGGALPWSPTDRPQPVAGQPTDTAQVEARLADVLSRLRALNLFRSGVAWIRVAD